MSSQTIMSRVASLPALPTVVARPISWCAGILRSAVGGLTWAPALGVAKPAILSVLSNIEVGTLLLVDEPGQTRHIFGQRLPGKLGIVAAEDQFPRRADTIPSVELTVKNEAFWMRLFLFADMGFAEAYMLGDFECEDLTSFFRLFIANRNQMNNGTTWFSSFPAPISHIARSTNTLSNALLNTSAHYDISNDMFAAFLSPDMTYSCPIWGHDQGGDNESLENAQTRKILRFINGAKIKPTDHVLEIGTGWGSFAIEAVKRTGCQVTTITLSKEQMHLAQERIRQAGFSDRIEVRLMDYRELPTPEEGYDKIVSIEMIEAVGQEYLATYFDCIHRLLKANGGIAMFQCITMPEGRHEAYSKSKDFINHYIFPGGYLPSTTQLLDYIRCQSQGSLIVENVENIGGHYARALRLWKEKFSFNFGDRIQPALLSQHHDMIEKAAQVFRRKWEYYFAYCEAGFATKTLGDVIITVAREGTLELMDGIPL